jgi:putative transposase
MYGPVAPRATFYRQQPKAAGRRPRRAVPRALPPDERHWCWPAQQRLVADRPPAQVYATLLDEGTFVCSIRTMYRVLTAHDQVRERRPQRRHPRYQAPELLATRPNALWSWDITKLKGPAKWTSFSST